MMKFIKLFMVAMLIVSCSEKKDEEKTTADYNLTIQTSAGEVSYKVENAVTPTELQKGLMHRDSLDADAGMIFDLSSVSSPVAMWMKNTKISLDMVFMDYEGKIIWVYENAVPYSEEYIIPPMPISAVLELNGGDIKKNGIKVGDTVKHKFFDETLEQPAVDNTLAEPVVLDVPEGDGQVAAE